jgi:hypothetical protein
MSTAEATDKKEPLTSVLKDAEESGDGEKASLGEMVDSMGAESLGPVLILFGLLALFPPIGAVPGVPIALGLVIVFYTTQFLFGVDHIWMPERLRKVSVKRSLIQKAQKKLDPVLSRVDKLFRERLTFLVGKTGAWLAAIGALFHAAFMIPLEFISAVAIPGLALTFFGIALSARDGLMMILGWLATAGAIYVLIFVVPWSKVTFWN